MNSLQRLIQGQKSGQPLGLYSICSANSYVLEACMEDAKERNGSLLIEATSNQVNQLGGYIGIKPSEYASWIKHLAQQSGLGWERIILGGDHLGPTPWQNESSETAMKLSEEMVYEYVAAGFQKIHVDASMPLKDDNREQGLDRRIIAQRTVKLVLAAERAVKDFYIQDKPLYVIGSEVPIAGGMQEGNDSIEVSQVDEVEETIYLTQKAFFAAGLHDAWERVIAIVVRPGVEFGDQVVIRYQPEKTKELSSFIEKQPQIIYEAHSTDYQTANDLQKMVKDHFAILKVGPALTFAFREAVFSLALIEDELDQINRIQQPSKIIEVLDKSMREDPAFWIKYYKGDEDEVKFARKYSLSDRSRYYWTKPQVKNALQLLLDNLSRQDLPWSLVNQYFPGQDALGKNERKNGMPDFLISTHIKRVIQDYSFACGEGLNLS